MKTYSTVACTWSSSQLYVVGCSHVSFRLTPLATCSAEVTVSWWGSVHISPRTLIMSIIQLQACTFTGLYFFSILQLSNKDSSPDVFFCCWTETRFDQITNANARKKFPFACKFSKCKEKSSSSEGHCHHRRGLRERR